MLLLGKKHVNNNPFALGKKHVKLVRSKCQAISRAILPPLTSSTQVVAWLLVSGGTRSTRKSRVPILYVTLATILL